MLTIVAAGALVAVGLRRGGWRKWTALAIIAGSIALFPALFYVSGAMDTVEPYQARHIFPLLVPAFFLMLIVDQDEEAQFIVPQAVWVTVFISLCQTITLHTLLLRFVQDAQERWEPDLNKHIEWWQTASVSPMMIWFLAICFATAALGTAIAMLTHTADKHEAPQES